MARLRHLSDQSDVNFGEGSYDVRNWSVKTRVDDKKVGKVHDVLMDENNRTRYLDVELDDGRHVLMPSGETKVEPSSKVVHAKGLNREALKTLPEYDHRPESITSERSRSIAKAYDEGYSDEHYHERSDYSASWARGTDRKSTGKLERLDKMDDVKVASHDSDPRGWDVVDPAGKRLGKVDHLIGDTGSMKARYLTVELDDDLASDRQVLMPVGHVDLDRDHKRVVSRSVDRTRATDLPEYDGRTIDRAYEREVTRHHARGYEGEREHEHPRYRSELDREHGEAHVKRSEEEVKVGKRERDAGEVDVKKHVEKERVREPVEVHKEEVEVERRAASGRASEADIKDEEVRVPVHEEEVVVEKEPRVKEEVVVKKKDHTETEMVEEDVRKERVDVERKGEQKRNR